MRISDWSSDVCSSDLIQLVLEHCGACNEFLLPLLAGIGLGHDVDGRTSQLRGKAHILAAAADGERKLVIGNHHFDPRLIFVGDDTADRCGLQRIDDESRGIFRPGNDVDLLALHFLDDCLNATALHADAGADRIDAAVMADNADLRAAARVTGSGLDFDDSVVDFGHFLREQLLHEFRMRAGEENLRPAIFAANIQDDRTDAIADAHYFARDLLIAADNTLGAAQIDDDMTELDALHDAGDDLSDAVLEFLILPLTLGVADLLENDLLGGLRIDAPQIDRRQRINDEVADLCTRLQLLRGLGIDLLEIILNHFDHFNDTPQAQVAAVRIQLCTDVIFGAITGTGRALDRIFHRFDNDGLVDHLFRRDAIRDSEQFGPICGNGGSHGCNPYPSV